MLVEVELLSVFDFHESHCVPVLSHEQFAVDRVEVHLLYYSLSAEAGQLGRAILQELAPVPEFDLAIVSSGKHVLIS